MKASRCWILTYLLGCSNQHEAIDSHHPFWAPTSWSAVWIPVLFPSPPFRPAQDAESQRLRKWPWKAQKKIKPMKMLSCPHWLPYNGASPFQVYRHRKSSRSVLVLKLPATTVFCPPDSWFIVRKEVCWPPRKAMCRLESTRKKDTY